MDYNIQTLSKSVNVLELVQISASKRIASIDASKLVDSAKSTSKPVQNQKSSEYSNFVEDNSLAYYILLNTWGQQILAVSAEAWTSVYQRIHVVGLVPVVRDCVVLSDHLIHGESYDRQFTFGFLTPLIEACGGDVSHLLQLLRYPKRFSPIGATAISRSSLQSFITLNSDVKTENVRIHSSWYIFELRHIIDRMLSGFHVRLEDGYFSNGVASDAKKPLLAKLRQYRKYNANFSGSPLYPISSSYEVMEKWRGSRKNRGFVKIVAVPKSYKAARIIAEEPASTQFNLQAIAKGMIRAINENGFSNIIDVTSQLRNQEYARLGSQDGSYATIDFSSASDSISEALAVDLLPQSVVCTCLENKQAYMEYTDTWSRPERVKMRRVVQMWSTSGSAITFISESIIIGAIAVLSTQVVANLLGEQLLDPSIFGDDVAIDDRAAEFFIDLATRIGLRVNREKSFFGESPIGWYRESCGVEYLNGTPMHSRYFPRRPVAPSHEGLSSLIDLEKRMFSDWTCRLFLINVVKTLNPRMTASISGSACADLWDTIDVTPAVYYRDSVGEPIYQPYAERHKHLILVSDYRPTALQESDRALLDMWYYHCYLVFGPLYEGPIERLLGVSTPRRNYNRDSVSPCLVWEGKLI